MFWWTAFFNAVDRSVAVYQVETLKVMTHNYFEMASMTQKALGLK